MLLTLLRHAKAEPGSADRQDWDRELDPKGRRDAAEVSRRLRERARVPTLILSSPAVRAFDTAKVFARALGNPTLITDERLYLATAKAMLEVVQERGGKADHVMVVGHNPGITEFADGLSAERSLDNMPTCSAYTLRFDIKDWKHLDWRTGTDADFEYPGRAI